MDNSKLILIQKSQVKLDTFTYNVSGKISGQTGHVICMNVTI